jgi:hypothetical protein
MDVGLERDPTPTKLETFTQGTLNWEKSMATER